MACKICFDNSADHPACVPTDSEMSWNQMMCGHAFCKSCLTQHIHVAISEGRLTIVCPAYGCKNVLGRHDIARIVDDDKLNKYDKDLSDIHRMRSDYDKLIGLDAGTAVKPCPKCNVLVSKDGGCNTVTCRCGWTIIWPTALILQAIRAVHFTLAPEVGFATPVTSLIFRQRLLSFTIPISSELFGFRDSMHSNNQGDISHIYGVRRLRTICNLLKSRSRHADCDKGAMIIHAGQDSQTQIEDYDARLDEIKHCQFTVNKKLNNLIDLQARENHRDHRRHGDLEHNRITHQQHQHIRQKQRRRIAFFCPIRR